MVLGVDVGGTFTDAVLLDGERLFSAKTPTTPADEAHGVMAATRAVLQQAGVGPGEVTTFAHGMTVATNALLEGRAARTALIATDGFTDVIELGRQARADLYRLCVAHPTPLVPPELRFAAAERTGPHGPLRPLAHVAELLRRVAAARPEAVAVVLLHSYAHPDHERMLGDELNKSLDGVHVSLSHEVVGTFREFERAATTEIDAALSPLVGGYLRRLADQCRAAGLPRPAVMQSTGGLTELDRAAGHAALTVLSGPAGGAAGAALLARGLGEDRVLCFDMGGTSCDVCVIADFQVGETADRRIGGRPLALPALDIHTVGAGGGSVAWRDGGGALRVGPRSAGATPGPACYRRGGTEPTVTDANVVLGRLPGQLALAGTVSLDEEAAQAAVGRLAAECDLSLSACAEGIVRVANAEMIGALRVMTVERGIDPRDHALLAFGGGGPLHATAIAAELGIERILCPRASGVLSALGLAAAAPRRDAASSHGGASVAELRARVRAELGGDQPARERFIYELRYHGQSFELGVVAGPDATLAELSEAFTREHVRRYGYAEPDGRVELVTVRVTAWGPQPATTLGTPTGAVRRGAVRARFDDHELDTQLLIGAPAAGDRVEGPAIWALPESTLAVAPGWAGAVAADGTIVLERRA